MRQRNHFGRVAIVLGVVAMFLAVVAKHAESFRGTASAEVLRWANRMGLVKDLLPGSVAELKRPGLLSLTDETAVVVLLWIGVYLSVSAIALALWAERRGENSLYLGTGLICGACALMFVSHMAGFIALGLGGLAVLTLRRAKHA
jgi:hypothetical protein